MKNLVLPLILLLLTLSGLRCIKDSQCTAKSPASEAADIQNFASLNGIAAAPHPTGLYYEIVDPGSGATPDVNSRIAITYTAKFLDGTIFDQRTVPNNQPSGPESPWLLGDLIEGWKIGIPLIQEGGQIRLIVPSSLAYGCAGYGAVPGNTILYFEVNLVEVH